MKRGFKSQCEKRAIEFRKQLGLEPTSPLSADELAKHVNVTIWSTIDVDGLEASDLEQLTKTDADSWSAFTLRIENNHHHMAISHDWCWLSTCSPQSPSLN